MSLIVTLYVREGIVMASDSRLTLNRKEPGADNATIHLAVGLSDFSYKTFLAPNGMGVSTYGAASIQGTPISAYVESFFAEPDVAQVATVEEMASRLLAHFRALQPNRATHFHVAGYLKGGSRPEAQVWRVSVAQDAVARLDVPGRQGVSWGGQADVLTRLLQRVGRVDDQGQLQEVLAHYAIPWGTFTLQDAIDFAVFAIRTTIDAIRFQPRAKTIGGAIDVLVIKPGGASWVQRKTLRGE